MIQEIAQEQKEVEKKWVYCKIKAGGNIRDKRNSIGNMLIVQE